MFLVSESHMCLNLDMFWYKESIIYLSFKDCPPLIHLQTCIDLREPLNLFKWCERAIKFLFRVPESWSRLYWFNFAVKSIRDNGIAKELLGACRLELCGTTIKWVYILYPLTRKFIFNFILWIVIFDFLKFSPLVLTLHQHIISGVGL